MAYMNNPYMNMYPQQNYIPQYNQGYNNMNFTQLPNQMQNQQMINTLNGCMVADFNEVSSKNTPLDGSSIFFPLVDGSAIYCKKLNVNTGASQLFTYKLVEKEQQTEDNVSTTLLQLKTEINELKNIVLEGLTKPQLPKLEFANGGDQK